METSLAMSNPLSSSRIAFFLPSLNGGGAERVIIYVAEGFVSQGWLVDLVVYQAVGAYTAQLPKQINLVNLNAGSPQMLTKTLALARYLKSHRPDILLTTLDDVNTAGWARRFVGGSTKVIMLVQNHLSQHFRARHSPLVQQLRTQIVKYFFPWTDQIVAVSQGVANDVADMMGIPPEKIQVIYNPVVRSDLPQKAAEPVDHPWFAEQQIPIIMGAGRLVKQKDFATLINAFALVRRRRPCRLVILGAKDHSEAGVKPELLKLIADLEIEQDVAFLGFVENPYRYMARAQVFVLSSIYEGFGIVVAEALAVGTSVVSTDCESGPAEILGEGKFGRLAPVGNSNALADAIVEALDCPQPPEVLKARARDFSVESSVSQYYELVDAVSGAARK